MREVCISLSVMPPRADTTTMTGSCWASTMRFTLKMLSTEPTDVPPNFITFIVCCFNEVTGYINKAEELRLPSATRKLPFMPR